MMAWFEFLGLLHRHHGVLHHLAGVFVPEGPALDQKGFKADKSTQLSRQLASSLQAFLPEEDARSLGSVHLFALSGSMELPGLRKALLIAAL